MSLIGSKYFHPLEGLLRKMRFGKEDVGSRDEVSYNHCIDGSKLRCRLPALFPTASPIPPSLGLSNNPLNAHTPSTPRIPLAALSTHL